MENEKLAETVSNHSVEIAKLKEQNKNQDREIYELKDTTALMYKITTSVELLAKESITTNDNLCKLDTKIDKTNEKVDKLDKDLSEVKNKDDEKDAKKWRGTIKIIGTAILSAIIGIVLAKIGLI